ncbi:MAG: ATP-binding protein, partial [Phycisphaerae bacterium]
MILKELIDNSLDACDELGTAPEIEVRCDKTSIEVADNGGGIPADTVAKMLNFTSRTSSRSMYVAPDRGSQGNALKTLTGIAHVIGGILWIESQGVTHR